MPQTTYNLDLVNAIAGQVVSSKETLIVGRYQASEQIEAGRMVELHTDGKLRKFRGGKKVGIATYRGPKEPGPWEVDDYVPVLRDGTIWAAAVDAGADLTDANFSYKDTTTADRGKATAAKASSAADAQVYDGGPCKFIGSASGLALLECKFSAEDKFGSPETPELISQAANDFAVTPEHNKTYELNTTAAASTVTLAASAPDGTVCQFIADGTKNGHTLTFRDATGPTAISAATTASKRVAAVAMKAAGKWAVTLTVGP